MMYSRKKSLAVRLIAAVVIVALLIPTSVFAETGESAQPYASKYLSVYSAYVYLAGNGLVQVWFDVQGTGMMDELGSLMIQIYESTDKETWTWVETFMHDSTPGMLGYNDFLHSGHVDYQGVEGRYYKAYVCVWAGKDGAGDTRYFWTSAKP